MVGVSGKSKGCKTCRKRKIACGLQQPECAQCVKSKRTCLGYDNGSVQFVPVRASLKDNRVVVQSYFDKLRLQSSTASEKHEDDEPILFENWDASPIAFSDALCGSANLQQLLGFFLATCIPEGIDGATGVSEEGTGPWLLQLPHLIMQIPALQTAVSAIAASALGRQRDDQDLINESLKFYVNGLRELQKSLWDPSVMYDDEILAACLCLGLYEIMECPGADNQGYSNHCKGCMQLVEGRGVDRHMSGVAHELFAGVRVQGALFSMGIHKPSFLSSPAWMTIPWKSRPKRPMDKLVDCLCEASAIYEENDRIEGLGPIEKLESWLGSVSKCWRMDATIQNVYKELKSNSPQPMYWSVLSKNHNPVDDLESGKVFPVAYEFPNLKVARSLMMCWAVSYLIWTGISLLYNGLAHLEFDAGEVHCSSFPECERFEDNMCNCRYFRLQPSGSYKYDISHLPPLNYRENPAYLVDNVCQSIEYCLTSNMVVRGAWSAGTPLVLVYETAKFFPGFERKLLWMEAVLKKLQGQGLRILSYTTTARKSSNES